MKIVISKCDGKIILEIFDEREPNGNRVCLRVANNEGLRLGAFLTAFADRSVENDSVTLRSDIYIDSTSHVTFNDYCPPPYPESDEPKMWLVGGFLNKWQEAWKDGDWPAMAYVLRRADTTLFDLWSRDQTGGEPERATT